MGKRGTKSPKGGCLNDTEKLWTSIKSLMKRTWNHGLFRHRVDSSKILKWFLMSSSKTIKIYLQIFMYENWAYRIIMAIRRMLHICRPAILSADVLSICFCVHFEIIEAAEQKLLFIQPLRSLPWCWAQAVQSGLGLWNCFAIGCHCLLFVAQQLNSVQFSSTGKH